MSSAIETKVMEQMEALPEDLQRQVLEFAQALRVSAQRGVPGKHLVHFAGAIPQDDLMLMRQVIDDECEQVEPDEW
jgi:hypothetical protein